VGQLEYSLLCCYSLVRLGSQSRGNQYLKKLLKSYQKVIILLRFLKPIFEIAKKIIKTANQTKQITN